MATNKQTNSMQVECFARTDIGGRENNEDAFVACDLHTRSSGLPPGGQAVVIGAPGYLLMVADGMGGEEGGEIASDLAINVVKDYLLANEARLAPAAPDDTGRYAQEIVLEQAFMAANERIRQEAEKQHKRGMGAAATAILLTEEHLHLVHVGDTRGHRIAQGQIEQLTKDMTLVAEMVERGELTPQQASVHPRRNMLTQCLGVMEAPTIQTRTLPLSDGDTFLLCSDGLSGVLPQPQIYRYATEKDSAREACRYLIEKSKEVTVDDNVTVAIAKVTVTSLTTNTVSNSAGTTDATPDAPAAASPWYRTLHGMLKPGRRTLRRADHRRARDQLTPRAPIPLCRQCRGRWAGPGTAGGLDRAGQHDAESRLRAGASIHVAIANPATGRPLP